jgi:GTP-binding protein Era
MNRAMVETIRRALNEVDLAVLVVDASSGFGAGDREASDLLRATCERGIVALNKIDLVSPKSRLLPMIETISGESGYSEIVPLSALTGEGCDRLTETIISLLPPGPPLFPDDYLTDQPERVIAAEWIREKLVRETRQELPHATAVIVERWNEREDGLLEIEASVLVERESQKKIVIGKGGELLKRVGSAARLELEEFLERRIFLRLWVRVRGDWRDDERMLRRLGLG